MGQLLVWSKWWILEIAFRHCCLVDNRHTAVRCNLETCIIVYTQPYVSKSNLYWSTHLNSRSPSSCCLSQVSWFKKCVTVISTNTSAVAFKSNNSIDFRCFYYTSLKTFNYNWLISSSCRCSNNFRINLEIFRRCYLEVSPLPEQAQGSHCWEEELK